MNTIKKNLINLNSILIILFPFALVSGPLIPEIFLFIIILSFIYLSQKEKKFFYYKNNFFKVFMFFFLIINISAFYNFNLISIKSSIFYFRFGLFSIAIFFFLNENKFLQKLCLYSFTLLILLLFIDSTIQFFFDRNIIGFEKSATGRVSSFFGDELVLGSFVSKFFLFYLALFFSEKISKNKFLLFLIIIIFFLIIFYSASRTAFGSYVLAISFFLIIAKEYKSGFKLILLCSALIIILSQFNDNNFKRVFNHTKYQMFQEYSSFNFLSQRHMLHLITAYKIFEKNIFLGAGVKSFRLLCDKNDFIPIDYITKTNKIVSFSKGQIVIKITAYANSSDGLEEIAVIDTKEFFEINKNKVFVEKYKFFPKRMLEVYLNRPIEHIKTYAQLIYQNGITREINFFNQKYYVHLDSNIFNKNESIISFKPLYDNGCNTHPHNFLIQILSETGLLGFSIYIIVLLYIFLGIINFFMRKQLFGKFYDYHLDIKIVLLFGSYLVFFFPIFPSGNFFNNWISMIIYFPIGFLLSFFNKNKTIKNIRS